MNGTANGIATAFAPAERAPAEEVERLHGCVASQPLLVETLHAVPVALLVLNRWRQIVFANRAALKMFGEASLGPIRGRRLGEVMGCAHVDAMPGGCGTTEFCRYCGAVNAMLRTIDHGETSVQECRLTRTPGGQALDLRVWSTPITVNGERLVVFAMTDIGAEKRREALEHVFFHDIANTAGGLTGLAELLPSADGARVPELARLLHVFSRQLVDEIAAQRELMQAESGTLQLHLERTDASALTNKLVEAYGLHPAAHERRIAFLPHPLPLLVTTDKALLGRVVGNMIKNALEATPPGGVVTVACGEAEAGIEIRVHNATVMPEEVRLQVFLRSFSTKGEGRGLGTYGMKLLAENYLKGRVGFTSAEGEGTTFRVVCPSLA